ncbi:MAG: hypothetical protein NXH72_02315 [Hyphomonadaceae bacterium]|nr:hypothetical protein [Hyphomonadaceae bacterium]
MYWSVFALAALGLVFAHSLKLPVNGSRFGAILAFVLGLLVSAFAIKALAAANGIGRTTDFDRFVNAAVLETRQDGAPLIVFTGASYSRNGIDPERLTLALRERGYPHRVVNLSIEAASILERDAHLKQFMSLSERVPELVFVEVAKDFDQRAAYMFGNSKFNTRAIEQFDLTASAWTGFGILGGACQGAKGCALDTAYLGLHAALNIFNIGLIGGGETQASVAATPAYDPQSTPRAQSVSTQALERAPFIAIQGPQWARSFRHQQRQRLQQAGVQTVAYYQPPTLDPEARAYVDGLCAGELVEAICLSPNDPALMQRLNGDHWFDPSHLLDSGTAIYNAWLVDQMIASGALEAIK